jgi:purine-nucleoside phosphorylase
VEPTLAYDDYRAAADAVLAATRHAPRVGVILGSGLGALCDAVEDAESIPVESIPNWPRSTVLGHVGRLVAGRLEGQTVLVQQGRAHYYEGYSLAQATLPVRVLQLLGVPTVIITNAAGGLNPGFRAGELMLIVDHINLIGIAGQNPLRGPNDPRLGERFPDMSQAYDPALIALARRVAAENGLRLHSGVYAALAGPSFETPADVRFLRQIGADAVGMSTVPEVIVARHGGLRVLGVSGISNVLVAPGAPGEAAAEPTSHEDVLAAGERLVPQLITLLRGVLRAL